MRLKVVVALVLLCAAALGWDWWQHGGLPQGEAVMQQGQEMTPVQREAVAPLLNPALPVTVVHFWATWCPPCMVEMPHVLNALQNVPEGVAVTMVSLDNPAPEAFYARQGIVADVTSDKGVSWVNDPQQARAKAILGKVMLPTTLVVDNRNGRLMAQIDGPLSWPPLMSALSGMLDHNQGENATKRVE